MGHEDRSADHQDGQRATAESGRQSLDDVRRGAHAGSLGDNSHGPHRGVVLGYVADRDARQASRYHRAEGTGGHAHAVHDEIAGYQEEQRTQPRRVAQRSGGTERLEYANRKDSQKRCRQANRGENERQRHQGRAQRFPACRSGKQFQARSGKRSRDRDRGDHRTNEGLEDVGSHSGYVADVVAHVVSDHAGVAGVVFGDPRFDLADQVGTHVSGLCVDAAAHAGEQRDGTRPHRESVQVHSGIRAAEVVGEDADSQQSQARYRQAHYRAAVEGHGQGRAHAAATGSFAGPRIR